MKSFLSKTYKAHSAIEDVRSLQELVNSVLLSDTVSNEMSFSLEKAVQSYEYACNISNNIAS